MKIKKIKFVSCFLLAVLILVSCEQENIVTDQEVIQQITGDWRCFEDSHLFGSNTYSVSLSAVSGNVVRVFNFYNIGLSVGTDATVSGDVITIQQQILEGGFTIVSGSGIVADDYREIRWVYRVDDGSGEVDEVTATYSR